jgi:hypothetical protein
MKRILCNLLVFITTLAGGIFSSALGNRPSSPKVEARGALAGDALGECNYYRDNLHASGYYGGPSRNAISICVKKDALGGLVIYKAAVIDEVFDMIYFAAKDIEATGSEVWFVTEEMNGESYEFRGLFLTESLKGFHGQELLIGKLDLRSRKRYVSENVTSFSYVDPAFVQGVEPASVSCVR